MKSYKVKFVSLLAAASLVLVGCGNGGTVDERIKDINDSVNAVDTNLSDTEQIINNFKDYYEFVTSPLSEELKDSPEYKNFTVVEERARNEGKTISEYATGLSKKQQNELIEYAAKLGVTKFYNQTIMKDILNNEVLEDSDKSNPDDYENGTPEDLFILDVANYYNFNKMNPTAQQYEVDVDADKVRVDGDIATIPGEAMHIIVDGQPVDTNMEEIFTDYKKVDGEWFYIPNVEEIKSFKVITDLSKVSNTGSNMNEDTPTEDSPAENSETLNEQE